MNSSFRRLVLLVLLVGCLMLIASGPLLTKGRLANVMASATPTPTPTPKPKPTVTPTPPPTPTPTPVTPLYQGSHDGADCNRIFGWAADTTRLNTSISVDIYDGSTFLMTVFANQSRPDVGVFLGDNGLHGFDFAVPAGLKNGQSHSITIKFGDTAVNLGNTPKSITCTSTSTRIYPIVASASNSYLSHLPAQAIDGNVGTWWNSGGAPLQWIQLDLGVSATVSQIRLSVAQSPGGQTTHEIYGGSNPQALALIGTLSGITQQSQWLEQFFTPAVANVRYLKVQTPISESWVAWNEIEVYGTSAPATGSRSPHNATQTAWQVPSANNIEVENFDDWNPPKGEGHTYHDDGPGNDWGAYRPGEDVDLGNSSDTGGGFTIVNAHGGEWLEYTVNVTSSPCDIQVRVASAGLGGRFHIEFDGVNRTGSIQVPNTGGWGVWTTLLVPNVSLPLGQHIMRLALDSNSTAFAAVGDFNYIRIVTSGSGTPTPTATPTPTPTPTPPQTPPSSAANQIGRLTSSGNGQRRTSYEYDELGRPTRTVNNFEGQSKAFRTNYGYPQNQLNLTSLGTVPVSQTFPDNEKVDYTYDASGAQQSIKTTPVGGGGQQTIISSISRNSRGQTIRAVYGNNAITTYTYNDATNLRLNNIKTVLGTSTLTDYSYGFDNNGNVTGVSHAPPFQSLSATYGYDSLDQLTSMTPAGQSTLPYHYDKLANLTNKENVAQTYGGAQSCAGCPANRGPHALATSGGVSYNYDANGNLVSTSNGTNITWNAENMPTRVVQNGVTIYQKSFLGESLWKKFEPGLNLTTYYLPSMRIEGTQVRKFFAGFAERSPGGSLKFYHGDHLGSASLVTDQAGTVIRRQVYKPYGEDRFVSGTFLDARYQFNFKEKEESTGFYDYGARLYNPTTGRWLSADNSGSDGPNRYTYVSNNPLRYIDPTGHAGDDPEWLGQQRAVTDAEKKIAAYSEGGFGVFATGIYNGTHNLAVITQAAAALGLGVSTTAVIPNNADAREAMGFVVRPASVISMAHIFSEAAYKDKQRGASIRLGAFSNGNLVVARTLEWLVKGGWSINVSSVELFNPNMRRSDLKSLFRNTGKAPVTIYLGTKDPFSGTFVLSPGAVGRFALGRNRVSVFMVPAGHDFASMVENKPKAFEIIHNGELTPEGRRYLTFRERPPR